MKYRIVRETNGGKVNYFAEKQIGNRWDYVFPTGASTVEECEKQLREVVDNKSETVKEFEI